MNKPKLPTPYELSRLAVALQGHDADKDPVGAVRGAMRLWFAAVCEITRAEKRDFLENLNEYSEARDLNDPSYNRDLDGPYLRDLEKAQNAAIPNPDDKSLWFSEQDSKGNTVHPAMDWVNKNATDDRDKFKTYKGFESAWLEYSPGRTSFERGVAKVFGAHSLALLEKDQEVEPDRTQLAFTVRVCELKRFLNWRVEKRLDADRVRKQKGKQNEGAGNPSKKIFTGKAVKSKRTRSQ